MAANREQLTALGRKTPLEEVRLRMGPGGTQLSYVDARFAQDRLDSVVGPANWQRVHQRDAEGNVTCGVGILCVVSSEGVTMADYRTEWVWKWDVGTESNIESLKGQYSDSFKRACVNWGIARDLYDEKSEARTKSGAMASGLPGIPTTPTGRVAHSDPNPDPEWVCPIHKTRRVVPAGTSASGKAYPAFAVCGQPGRECDQKPPRKYAKKKPKPMVLEKTPEPAPSSEDDDGWVTIGEVE